MARRKRRGMNGRKAGRRTTIVSPLSMSMVRSENRTATKLRKH